MARKKEIAAPLAQRASMSGFSKPDALGRGPWAIDWTPHGAGVPSVDLQNRRATLWAPAVTAIEAHEGWHIAYTPPKGARTWQREIADATGADVVLDDVLAVEDGRINRIGLTALRELSTSKHDEVFDALGEIQGVAVIKPRVLAAHKAGNLRQAARLIVAGLPHTEPLLYDKWARKKDMQDMVRELRGRLRRAGTGESSVATVCEYLAGLPSATPLPTPSPKTPPKPEWERPDIGDDRDEHPDIFVPSPPAKEDDIPWGPMTIRQPRLTESLYDGTDAMTRPTAEPGTLPKYPHRWRPWEGSFDIFARKRRDRGPRARLSLLIDGSGSMGVTNSMIAEIQERLPATTCGIYASTHESHDAGTLVVVAAGGKRLVFADRYELRRKHDLGSGNVVDGPALRWLGRLPGPRLWVSDGSVTGVDDRSCRTLRVEADAIVAACGIIRLPNAETLFAWLDSRGFKKSAVKRLR